MSANLQTFRTLSLLFAAVVLSSVCKTVFAAENQQSWFSVTAESKNSVFAAELVATESAMTLNTFLVWELTLKETASGEPVVPARISVGGGMPMHGHGLPSQPQVTEHLGEGRYRVEGLKFNMLGKWVLQFDVTTRTTSDTVVFEFALDY